MKLPRVLDYIIALCRIATLTQRESQNRWLWPRYEFEKITLLSGFLLGGLLAKTQTVRVVECHRKQPFRGLQDRLYVVLKLIESRYRLTVPVLQGEQDKVSLHKTLLLWQSLCKFHRFKHRLLLPTSSVVIFHSRNTNPDSASRVKKVRYLDSGFSMVSVPLCHPPFRHYSGPWLAITTHLSIRTWNENTNWRFLWFFSF